jgi:hypothetical protein
MSTEDVCEQARELRSYAVEGVLLLNRYHHGRVTKNYVRAYGQEAHRNLESTLKKLGKQTGDEDTEGARVQLAEQARQLGILYDGLYKRNFDGAAEAFDRLEHQLGEQKKASCGR